MAVSDPVRERFESALASLVGKLESDRTVVAAMLFGSLAYARVWERSDIDLIIVRDDREARRGSESVPLTEQGVLINASVMTRVEFRRTIQSATGAFLSVQSLGRLLFTRDEGLRRVLEDTRTLGEHDRRVALLRSAAGVLPLLDKTEKWLEVTDDPHYAAVWLMDAVRALALVEVLLRREIPDREALVRAVELNPAFFERVYTRFLGTPPTRGAVRTALDLVDGYLVSGQEQLFGLLLDYLREQATVRSLTEISAHFDREYELGYAVYLACPWLAAHGVLVPASVPYHLTEHSQVELEAQAYVIPG